MSKSDKSTVVTAQAATEKPDSKRRNFLIGAGLGGVGAAAVAAAALSGVAPEAKNASEPVAEADGKSKGYQETEHVRRYYGTTRI